MMPGAGWGADCPRFTSQWEEVLDSHYILQVIREGHCPESFIFYYLFIFKKRAPLEGIPGTCRTESDDPSTKSPTLSGILFPCVCCSQALREKQTDHQPQKIEQPGIQKVHHGEHLLGMEEPTKRCIYGDPRSQGHVPSYFRFDQTTRHVCALLWLPRKGYTTASSEPSLSA